MELGVQVVPAVLLALLYLRRLVALRRAERPVPLWRAGAFAAGLATVAGGAAAPLEGRFATHMVQHLLIGDLGPLLLVLGVTGPVLRPVLALRPVRLARVLAHPLVALPLWATLLVLWHLTPLYDAALRSDAVHGLQHLSFLLGGAVLWAALVEPLPGPSWFTAAWKLPYVLGMWLVALTVSQVLLWSGHSYYAGYSLADQRAGGGVMLVEGSIVMLGVAICLLLRVLAESEARQSLLEQGLRPEAAARAARYGRA
jgi:putative membrane protein